MNPELVPLSEGELVASAYQLNKLPPGTIIVGSDGYAWQSFETPLGRRWRATDGIEATLSSLLVFANRRPLRVLYIFDTPMPTHRLNYEREHNG